MADRDWDRNDRRDMDRDRNWDRDRDSESRRYYDRGTQTMGDRSSSSWDRNINDREARDWHGDRDWRSRNQENRGYDYSNQQSNQYSNQDYRGSDRNFDTRQYSNRDYIGRDYGREDRYRDDQNRDWEHHRWESSRDRDRHAGGEGFEHGRDWTHTGSRHTGSSDTEYRNRDLNMNRGSDYTRNWGAQAFGNAGAGFGGGLTQGGRYTGKGPKNWQRSDERIREDINEELTRNPDVDATEIDVTVLSGEVTLTGTLDNRHEKREAEECAWRVTGVKDVHNQIKVKQGIGSMIASVFKGDSENK